MNLRTARLLALVVATAFLNNGCSKTPSTSETTDAAGTIVAAKRALNTDDASAPSSENTNATLVATDLAAAEEAAKGPSMNSTMEAKDAANAAAGGPKNGDREIDHNKW